MTPLHNLEEPTHTLVPSEREDPTFSVKSAEWNLSIIGLISVF